MVPKPGDDPYIPDRGDVVWLTFDPRAGHEQAGRRPAVVLSPASYNGLVGLALFVPVTRQIKGYPFEVSLPSEINVVGVVLSDQLKSLDWRARQASYITTLPTSTTAEILRRATLLVTAAR